MEVLGILEKKLSDLVELVKSLKEKNGQLAAECATLQEEKAYLQSQIDELEEALLKDKGELDQEKELTRMVVDGLIKSIDSLVDSESAS